MENNKRIEQLEEAKMLIENALELLEQIAADDPSFKAYVYDQISEHVENANPYNQSIESKLQELRADPEVEVYNHPDYGFLCEECLVEVVDADFVPEETLYDWGVCVRCAEKSDC